MSVRAWIKFSTKVFYTNSYTLLYHRLQCTSCGVDANCSIIHPIAVGVPQESTVDLLLYLIYTNDLLVLPPVTIPLIADDTMYHYSSMFPRYAAVVVQRQLASRLAAKMEHGSQHE